MKLTTFQSGGMTRWGVVTEGGIVDMSQRSDWPTLRGALEAGGLPLLESVAEGAKLDYRLDEIEWLPPVPDASKILCIGVNYRNRNAEYKDGSEEQKYPSIFVRFASSFVGHETPIVKPRESEQLDYEGEIVLVIGKSGRRIPESEALSYVAGMTIANEGSVRDWLRHGKFNVTQGKNFDRTGSLGPWMVTVDSPEQMGDMHLRTLVNGEVRQEDRTSNLAFPFAWLISYISTFTTIGPGTLILTGTPTGAGARFDPPRYLKEGDVVRVEVSGIGTLENAVATEK